MMDENTIYPQLLTPERKQFVTMLAERGIPFLIVGGEAVRAAGLHRLTKDLDIVVPRDRQVIDKIKQVALRFGYRIPRATEALLASRKFSAMYIRLAPREQDTKEITHHVDILFADVYLPDFERALRDGIEIPDGCGVHYANVVHLLEMKEHAVVQLGRSQESLLKDRADIAFLRELLENLRKAAFGKNLPLESKKERKK